MTTIGRLKYDRRFNYDNKVLLENWYEERQHYVQNKHHHITNYDENYVSKPYSKPSNKTVWNNIVMGHGLGARILIDHHGRVYHDNFSTVYDISYNHLPKWSKGERLKRHLSRITHALEPQQDFCKNYGNITDYGIREQKKIDWIESKKEILNSVYQDSYYWPSKDDYPKKRFCPPKGKSCAAIEETNATLIGMQMRGKKVPITYEAEVIMPKIRDCPLLLNCPPYK